MKAIQIKNRKLENEKKNVAGGDKIAKESYLNNKFPCLY